ncbi:MlaD family protein [Nocardia sp. NPDC050713]|uniref:MlaD family protein n=1 Tax=Nocardia sp. NPDC050713 TaxID=3154511 RepID=UPI0033EF52CF
MQTLTRWYRIRWKPQAPEGKSRAQSDLRWGIAGLAAVLVVAAALGMARVIDFGTRTYTALMADAAAVRVGDEVRLAGIAVGSVETLTAKDDHVEMRFTVEDDVFLGKQTSIDIRMLTIVGGHYIALVPAGIDALDEPIPADRVILPYSLTELFQDAIEPVRQIDGGVLRDNLGALQKALKDSPKSFDQVSTGVNSIVDVLDKQNADVSRAVAVADEYLSTLRDHPEITKGIIDSIRLLEDLILANIDQTESTLTSLEQVVTGLAPLGRAWDTTLEPMARPLADSIPPIEELVTKLKTLLDSVHTLGEKITPLVSPSGGLAIDHSGSVRPAPALCIPMPGRAC